ncbi:MAG: phenylalanine--tRNA ligase subunit alpha, partial [Proteobacteria bacterium]|nr:phenylalanine--tRNA ligase subunit alpha [Pseudomonadota bacterium]
MTTENLDALRAELLAELAAAPDLEALEALRVSVLGRQGRITELMKGLGQVAAEERRERGQALNLVKDAVAGAIAACQARLESAALDARLVEEHIDMTLPPRPQPAGRIHPISQTIDEMVAIFCEMGFEVAEGPHIETDFNNFTALNIPPEHPARQEHDTFYLPEKEDGSRRVLRTHTSPVQIRTMLDMKPPIRIIVPGRTFRA